ncbi:IS4 family transposase [Micromonospora inyonensis]|uniref:Insertion element 4 transposase N-terminal n=1 Tax=Micromonospora inyonensis TaxID=47866 RepID=A0A1C6SAD4_9ACTN|nr:Insertion element 4 transposase N-terminal [Micromonospora inyonensis]
MSETVAVTADQVSLGVLVSAVPRDAVDAAVARFGVGAKRSDGKLPPHVVAYLTMALCLFGEDDYEEVATKVTGALTRFGCWDAAWSVPTASGISQARQRLGAPVMEEIFESVVQPVGTTDTRGAWLRRWRVLAIDGFDVDLPDTPGNAAEFGYAGSGGNRSAYPKARVVALAECGTHAFLAGEVSGYGTGERTLAMRLYPRLRRDELLTADRGFYSFDAWSAAAGTGAALLWRAPTGLRLPVVRVLADGTYVSVVINPKIRGARRDRVVAAARAGQDLAPELAYLVRVVEYDVPDRDGDGTGELIVLLTTVLEPAEAHADELAEAYHLRWEDRDQQRPAQDAPTRPGPSAALKAAGAGLPGNLGLADRPPRPRRVDHPRGRSRRPRPRPDQLHPRAANRPPYRHRDGGHSPWRLD